MVGRDAAGDDEAGWRDAVGFDPFECSFDAIFKMSDSGRLECMCDGSTSFTVFDTVPVFGG